MKITGVEAYLLSFPVSDSEGERNAMLVRIAGEQGLFGYAPAVPAIEGKQAIDRIIAPFLSGRVVDPDALRTLFQQGPGGDAGLNRIYSAVEIALYDLAGKERGVPVSELVGGRVRDRIRLYASTGATRLAEVTREAVSAGFGALKFQAVGAAAEDLAAVRAIRESAGADFDIMIDASAWSSNYSRETIEALAIALRDLRVRFIEEPLPFADHDAYARLRARVSAPLAAGRHEPSELRFLDLIETAAVDYVQMDVIAQGGYATARRLFPDIARAGLRFTFSSYGTALETIAAAHLGVCWPESVVRWLEYPSYLIHPLGMEMLKQPLAIERGDLVVPRGPGLGVEIDESVIWRYPWAGEVRAASD